ncbi:hypothetical protein [Bifidobacterium callitrichos]|uniref:hypothetical protein n=1 Tax=Bifidobacterium callitrichos TaxID=762209 RepID=UPI0011B24264|nr:hypothetical protein [Bifidobacterium callitrichos]
MPLNAFFGGFGVERHDNTPSPPCRLFDMLSKGAFSNDFAIVGIARTSSVADLPAAQREKSPKSR